MGKREKAKKHRQQSQRYGRGIEAAAAAQGDDDDLPSSAYDLPNSEEEEEEEEEEEDAERELGEGNTEQPKEFPSKFLLYQQSVQAPKGDISYLQKFFLMYVGGRFPLHLQEDFCGTALLSTEWLRSDPRRTAVGVDLDLEALQWGLGHNVNMVGSDGYSRISLLHGNVLQPAETSLVEYKLDKGMENMTLDGHEKSLKTAELAIDSECTMQMGPLDSVDEESAKKIFKLPARDIVCAFNYSCCCLQKRTDLVLYFKHALRALSKRGGIFVMDLYGGTSSECKLRLQRRLPNFTYVWEQGEFDIVNRTTRIMLHFHLGKNRGTLRHAFSYNWRLWSLPEVKDCLEEAGFKSVHFWIREMPDTQERHNTAEFHANRDAKYEEVGTFQQQDAWNAYVVAVATTDYYSNSNPDVLKI